MRIKSLKKAVYALPIFAGRRKRRAIECSSEVVFREGFSLYTFPHQFPPEWEAAERDAIASLLPDHDVFIDIGANHGLYAVMAAHFGKPAIAVEPEPANLAVLNKNAAGRDIEVVGKALSSEKGEMQLYGDGVVASLSPGWQPGTPFRHLVAVTTMDLLLKGRFTGKKLLIKIDVEGVEDRVLAGASATLDRPATWIIESMATTPGGAPSESLARTKAIMADKGYRISELGKPMGKERHSTNWLFDRVAEQRG